MTRKGYSLFSPPESSPPPPAPPHASPAATVLNRGTIGTTLFVPFLLLFPAFRVVYCSRVISMPRIARRKSISNIYHVMIRGINRQNIFEEDEDRLCFMKILDHCKEISGFKLYAFEGTKRVVPIVPVPVICLLELQCGWLIDRPVP